MEGIYNIKKMAEMLEVSIGALRKWEEDYNLKIPRNEIGHRFYTNKELDVFNRIIKLKNEGANIHLIRKILSNEGIIEQLQEDNLPSTAIEKLNLEEFENNIIEKLGKYILDREHELKKDFDKKLERAKDDIIEKQRDQIKIENKKLLKYIAVEREQENKKGFFSRLLGK